MKHLNEKERAEFELHKQKAEAQLNQMYFGANKKSQNKEGLIMPPFLAPPPSNQKNKNKEKMDDIKEKNSDARPKSIPKTKAVKSNNILNFLNFKGIKMDNDRLIILAICLLLAGEETDELLMLALIYIML